MFYSPLKTLNTTLGMKNKLLFGVIQYEKKVESHGISRHLCSGNNYTLVSLNIYTFINKNYVTGIKRYLHAGS
jgi:hypothetical protein